MTHDHKPVLIANPALLTANTPAVPPGTQKMAETKAQCVKSAKPQ